MKTYQVIVSACILSSLLGCQSQQQKPLSEVGKAPMTTAQLEALYQPGVSLKWETSRGSGVSHYKPDGSGTIDWGKGVRSGQWRIVNHMVCTRWDGVRSGAEKCYQVIQAADGQLISYDSQGNWAGTSQIISQ